MEDPMLAGQHTSISPAAEAADDETGRPPPLPTRVFLNFLPPGEDIDHDEVPTSITVCPPIGDLCFPEPDQVPRTTVTAPARGPTTPVSFTAHPSPHTKEKHH